MCSASPKVEVPKVPLTLLSCRLPATDQTGLRCSSALTRRASSFGDLNVSSSFACFFPSREQGNVSYLTNKTHQLRYSLKGMA